MINLYSHGGSGNHGCEAIVRATCAMLDEQITLFSNHKEQDIKYQINRICNVQSDEIAAISRGSKDWLFSSAYTKLTGRYDLAVKCQHQKLLSQVHKGEVWLSIGGDNYCYAGTDLMAALNKYIRKAGAKTVLWGCSVEPELLKNKAVAADLAGFDLITAREPISYEALRQINPNTVKVSDPAFTLQTKQLPLPDGWQQGNMIGINASPLILDSAEHKDTILNAYRNLIRYILENTDCGIALIPHVVWNQNDDRTILKLFYEDFKATGRVIMLDDYNCEEIKGFISRCRLFVGARTHATIAAYSTCVPTLVLGYSVKSKGIARDLFGTEEHYVLPVQQMSDENALAAGLKWMLGHETEIRTHLTEIMPDYIQKAYLAKEALLKLS